MKESNESISDKMLHFIESNLKALRLLFKEVERDTFNTLIGRVSFGLVKKDEVVGPLKREDLDKLFRNQSEVLDGIYFCLRFTTVEISGKPFAICDLMKADSIVDTFLAEVDGSGDWVIREEMSQQVLELVNERMDRVNEEMQKGKQVDVFNCRTYDGIN